MSELEDVLAEELLRVHAALDDALGDSDISWMDDETLRSEEPAQWAAQKLAHVIRRLSEYAASLRAENERMKGALKPFANVEADGGLEDSVHTYPSGVQIGDTWIDVERFRDARRVLDRETQ